MGTISSHPQIHGRPLGPASLRGHHGHRYCGRGLAHHPHAGPQDGQAPACARLRGRNDRRNHFGRDRLFRHARFDHARGHRLHYGSRGGQTAERPQADGSGAHLVGLGAHVAGHGGHRLRPGAIGADLQLGTLRRPPLDLPDFRRFPEISRISFCERFFVRFCYNCVTNRTAMFSLQKLFGKDDKFFTLMEASAEECRTSIESLIRLLETPQKKRSLDAFIEARRKDKRITKELTEHLLKTFVTPLEREDIEALAEALYKIPKTVEKFSERLLIADSL